MKPTMVTNIYETHCAKNGLKKIKENVFFSKIYNILFKYLILNTTFMTANMCIVVINNEKKRTSTQDDLSYSFYESMLSCLSPVSQSPPSYPSAQLQV